MPVGSSEAAWLARPAESSASPPAWSRWISLSKAIFAQPPWSGGWPRPRLSSSTSSYIQLHSSTGAATPLYPDAAHENRKGVTATPSGSLLPLRHPAPRLHAPPLPSRGETAVLIDGGMLISARAPPMSACYAPVHSAAMTKARRVSWRTESPAPLHDARTRSPGAEPSLPPPPPPTAAKHSILPRAPPEASAGIPSAVRRCTPRPTIGGSADRSRFWRVWMTDVLGGAEDGLREEQGAEAGARS
ncbi:hypothetical protein PSPO01_00024 [Paraphaeosphaeria sporulosa]